MKRTTEKQLMELHRYSLDYIQRGIIGTWWELAHAIQSALSEIEGHRQKEVKGRQVKKQDRRKVPRGPHRRLDDKTKAKLRKRSS